MKTEVGAIILQEDPLFGDLHELVHGTHHRQATADIEPWRQAVEKQARHWDPEAIHDTASHLLLAYPYEFLHDRLATFDGSKHARHELNQLRRFLMIGRDCLRLTTRGGSQYPSLDATVRELGHLVDRQPTQWKSLEQAIAQVAAHGLPDGRPCGRKRLAARVRQLFETSLPTLINQPDATQCTDTIERYHWSRRHLRRVVHGAVVAATLNPSSKRARRIAVQGVILNQTFGGIKDELYAPQLSPSELVASSNT